MHSYFSWDFLTIIEPSAPFDEANYDNYTGVCPGNGKKLCVHEQWGLPESMISANGGQISIKFTSDNYGSMEGFWLEYEIGIQDTFR